MILDTAGRLTLDEVLMAEVTELVRAVRPVETLLVVDAMSGQEAVGVAQAFAAAVPLTGLVLTKIDGDARGGAALSISAVTGLPVKFLGTGEKTDALEPFHPDRLAGRILGMGDVLTLIERAQDAFDATQAEKAAAKLQSGSFSLEDMLDQLQQVKKMGPLGQVMEMIPGLARMARQAQDSVDRGDLRRTEAIIRSMTAGERRDPTILNGSRRRRIAAGSGTSIVEVNRLVKQFGEMQKLMKQLRGGRRAPGGLRPLRPREAHDGRVHTGSRRAGYPAPGRIDGRRRAGAPGGRVALGRRARRSSRSSRGPPRWARVLLTSGATTSAVEGWIPAGTVAYLEARADLPGDQRENVGNIIATFPGFKDQSSLDSKIDQALDEALQRTGISWTSDLKPWVAGEVGVALTGDLLEIAAADRKDPAAATAPDRRVRGACQRQGRHGRHRLGREGGRRDGVHGDVR